MARAQPLAVEVLVLVDDYSGFSRLLGEHGFSALITVRYEGGRDYNVLLDTGASGRVLLENASRLGIDLGKVDAVVLSHRHYDHTGGLPSISHLLSGKPLVAHPDVLKPCYSDSEGFKRFNVGLTSEARRSLGGFEAVLAKTPFELAPGLWFLGEVERRYDNTYAVKGFMTLSEGGLAEEPMLDDTGIAVKVGGRVVVVAGCSHSGIQNIARRARLLTNAGEVVAMGGFHLAAADEETLNRVAEELEAEAVTEVHAGHCTGFRGEAELLKRYGERMHKIHSGYKAVFKEDA